MAYSKAKLKNNGDKDKFLPTRTLLYVSVRHIFINLTSGGSISFEKEGFAQWLDHKQHIPNDDDKNSFVRLIYRFE